MRWNRVTDWRKQSMYLYVNIQWDHVNAILLDGSQLLGTIKIFEVHCGSDQKKCLIGHSAVP